MKEPLKLPKTLRAPEPNEIPMNSSVLQRLKERATANIVEGYTLNLKDDNPDNRNLAFKFYSEININNAKLWKLFLELANLMPNDAGLIFGHIDEDLDYGNYIDKASVLRTLAVYEKELAADTFIDWGLIHHTEETLIEVFVDSSKYIKFWGVDIGIFKMTLQKFGLKQIDNLEFVDEYPKVRIPLSLLDSTAIDTHELLKLLKNKTDS